MCRGLGPGWAGRFAAPQPLPGSERLHASFPRTCGATPLSPGAGPAAGRALPHPHPLRRCPSQAAPACSPEPAGSSLSAHRHQALRSQGFHDPQGTEIQLRAAQEQGNESSSSAQVAEPPWLVPGTQVASESAALFLGWFHSLSNFEAGVRLAPSPPHVHPVGLRLRRAGSLFPWFLRDFQGVSTWPGWQSCLPPNQHCDFAWPGWCRRNGAHWVGGGAEPGASHPLSPAAPGLSARLRRAWPATLGELFRDGRQHPLRSECRTFHSADSS